MKVVRDAEGRWRTVGRWTGLACAQGHPWTPESTMTRRDGSRTCRICWNARARAAYAAKREGRITVHPNAAKTHCKRDHPFSPDNTIIRRDGRRACRACQSLLAALSRQRLAQPPDRPGDGGVR